MICANCGAELSEDCLYCPSCGRKIENERFCKKCGRKLEEGQNYCPNCGNKIAFSDVKPLLTKKTKTSISKKRIIKILIIIGFIVLFAALIIFGYWMLYPNEAKTKYAEYLYDTENYEHSFKVYEQIEHLDTNSDKYRATCYEYGKTLYEKGELLEASKVFETIVDYKDSFSQRLKIEYERKHDSYYDMSKIIGETIEINDIKWDIIECSFDTKLQKNIMLLITDDILFKSSFKDEMYFSNVTELWNTSNIRKKLTNDLNKYISDSYKQLAVPNYEYSDSGDILFLLDADNYIAHRSKMNICETSWWLLDVSKDKYSDGINMISFVRGNDNPMGRGIDGEHIDVEGSAGTISGQDMVNDIFQVYGGATIIKEIGVRPAMWIAFK